jgi:hypothetical protein
MTHYPTRLPVFATPMLTVALPRPASMGLEAFGTDCVLAIEGESFKGSLTGASLAQPILAWADRHGLMAAYRGTAST